VHVQLNRSKSNAFPASNSISSHLAELLHLQMDQRVQLVV
jgi:hypothetical protein